MALAAAAIETLQRDTCYHTWGQIGADLIASYRHNVPYDYWDKLPDDHNEYTLDLRAYDEAPPAPKQAPEVRARVTESGGLLIESSTMAAGAPYLADAELIDAGVAASGARVAAVDRWGYIHVLRLARSSSYGNRLRPGFGT